MPIYLYLWSFSIAGILSSIILRKKHFAANLFYGSFLAFCMLSFDVIIGLNRPNPDHVRTVQVAVQGDADKEEEYIVQRTDGAPVGPEAKFFVLRLDTDPVAREVLRDYAQRTRNTMLMKLLAEYDTKGE